MVKTSKVRLTHSERSEGCICCCRRLPASSLIPAILPYELFQANRCETTELSMTQPYKKRRPRELAKQLIVQCKGTLLYLCMQVSCFWQILPCMSSEFPFTHSSLETASVMVTDCICTIVVHVNILLSS